MGTFQFFLYQERVVPTFSLLPFPHNIRKNFSPGNFFSIFSAKRKQEKWALVRGVNYKAESMIKIILI
jgi:hypothetical protein